MAEAVVVTKRPVVPGTAKVGPAYATVPMPITIYDMARIKEDPNYNLYVIPFGTARGMIVLRKLKKMDWKGVKGEKFWEVARKHVKRDKEGKPIGPGLVEGLKTAIAVSKAYSGVGGIVYIDGIPYPRKAIAQKRWKEEKAAEVSKIKATLPY